MTSTLVTNPAGESWRVHEQQIDYSITRRPMPTCRRRMPLHARSVCWAIFRPGQYEDQTSRPFAKILWGVAGTGAVTFADGERMLRPGEIAVLFPGRLHRARASDRPWEVRWWTMDGPQAVSMMAGFGFEREGIHQAGPAPLELFERLRLALEDVSLAGEVSAAAAAYELLAAASAHAKYVEPSPIVDAARQIIEAQWHDPSLDINALARQLRTHRSSLSRLFSARHGLSPSQYLVRMRLSHALSLLKQTNLPVKEISIRCGFADPNYFARFFRRTQHMSPLEWRKH